MFESKQFLQVYKCLTLELNVNYVTQKTAFIVEELELLKQQVLWNVNMDI